MIGFILFCSRLLLIFTVLISPGFAADAFEDRWRQITSSQPPDVTFTLAASNATFYVGEAIPLELTFRAVTPGYSVAPWSAEEYVADAPPKAVRVLEPIGGRTFTHLGGPGRDTLSADPVTRKSYLNDSIRFTLPGTYRVYAISRRLSRFTAPVPPNSATPLIAGIGPADVVSNLITLRIESPPRQWIAAQIAHAVRVLDEPTPVELRVEAHRTLVFLDSWEAVTALSQRLDEAVAGIDSELMESQHRTELLPVLEARLEAPGQRVTSWFIDFLVRYAEVAKFSPEGLNGRAALEFSGQKTREYYGRLDKALPLKSTTAAGACAWTLLTSRYARDADSTPRIASWVVKNFQSLGEISQSNMLQNTTVWHLIAEPSLVPALLKLLEVRDLRDLATKRLLELDPAEARKIILSESRARRYPWIT